MDRFFSLLLIMKHIIHHITLEITQPLPSLFQTGANITSIERGSATRSKSRSQSKFHTASAVDDAL
jgi:hypothetical protein